jgi:hypothetical protein
MNRSGASFACSAIAGVASDRPLRSREASARGARRSEAGRIGHLKLDVIRDFAEALGGRVVLPVTSGAGDPRLLIDEGHAAIGEHWKRRLERWGWLLRVEVSFNRYGDRGRVDLLAFHPESRALLVVEVKTVLWDVQATLGSMDVKRRIAPLVAREIGWQPTSAVPLLLVAASTTVRRRLSEHASLFSSFDRRGRAAISWLRDPRGQVPKGALILTSGPDVASADRRRAGRRRVRQVTLSSRSGPPDSR